MPIQSQSINEPARIPAKIALVRRDLVLLPAIFLLTALILLTAGEVSARLIFPQTAMAEPCEYATSSGLRYHPGCTSQSKLWEGPWITEHFNACGYRGPEPCATLPPNTRRLVVLGTSTAHGTFVNFEDFFPTRTSAWLSARCGFPVDAQTLATEPVDLDHTDTRMAETLSLHPSAIALVIGPFDLVHQKDPPGVTDTYRQPLFARVIALLRQSRLFQITQYYLYRDPSFQVRAFLLNGDSAGYVREPLSPAWQQRVDAMGDLLGRLVARADGVPITLMYYPERAQTALAREAHDPPGVDPYAIGDALAGIAAQHGVHFVDATHAFAAADFDSLYYLTDGHPKAGGHAALATALEQSLAGQPAFANCRDK